MSFIKNKLKKFKKFRSISPCVQIKNQNEFCSREIHDPLFECCCEESLFSDDYCLTDFDDFYGDLNICANKKKKTKKKTKSRTSFTPVSLNFPKSHSELNLFDLKLNEVIKKKKPSAKKKSKKLNSQRDCVILSNSNINSFRSLCDQLENTYITPKISKMFSKIPEHDKKIINRMAMKRTQEVALIEDARIARKFWHEEKAIREELINEQNEQFSNVIREKREREQKETEARLAHLEKRQRFYEEKLRSEINAEDYRLYHRQKNLELKREIEKCEKRQEEFVKYNLLALNHEEQQMEKDLQKHILIDKLDNRLSHAESIRDRLLQAYRCRVQTDNQIEKCVHESNYDDVKKLESFKTRQLKDEISIRDRKYKKFLDRKNRIFDESRNQAKTTAELRDMVKRSISPENLSFRVPLTLSQGRIIYDRPISNMSFESHLKLG